MFLQQELWLIIVGLIVAYVVKKHNGSQVAFMNIAKYTCISSLIVGELGMVTQLFFPSDFIGMVLTSLAALVAAKVVIGERTAARRNVRTSSKRNS